MKILNVKQGSAEWLEARMGICTSSELKNLITPKMEPRKWSTEMPNTYLAAKLSEKWRGEPDEGFVTADMENGSIREHQAIPWFEGIYEVPIKRVGFVVSDDGSFGFSPDGMFADGGGIECKIPSPKTHAKYLLAGEVVPDGYLPQVHGSIYGAGSAYWKFLSWRPDFPKLVVNTERNEVFCATIAEAVEEFNERFGRAWKRLVEMNGGEPERPKIETEMGSDGSVTKRIKPDYENPILPRDVIEAMNGVTK